MLWILIKRIIIISICIWSNHIGCSSCQIQSDGRIGRVTKLFQPTFDVSTVGDLHLGNILDFRQFFLLIREKANMWKHEIKYILEVVCQIHEKKSWSFTDEYWLDLRWLRFISPWAFVEKVFFCNHRFLPIILSNLPIAVFQKKMFDGIYQTKSEIIKDYVWLAWHEIISFDRTVGSRNTQKLKILLIQDRDEYDKAVCR